MRKRYLVSLKTQFHNLGDLLITGVLVTKASRHVQVLCITDNVPPAFVQDFKNFIVFLGAENVRFVTRAQAMRAMVAAIWGGGGMFLTPGAVGGDRRRAHVRFFKAVGRLSANRFRIAQVGCSYGTVGPCNREALSYLVAHRHPVSVRDATSADRFEKVGVTIPIVPDLAWALPVQGVRGSRRVLIAMRGHDAVVDAQAIVALTHIVAACRTVGLEIAVYYQVEEDHDFSVTLSDMLGIQMLNTERRRPSFDEAIAIYQDAAFVFSNRLHSLLVAACGGALPVAVLHEEESKIRGVFGYAGLEELMVGTHNLSEEAITRILADDGVLRARFDAAQHAQKALVDAYFEKFHA